MKISIEYCAVWNYEPQAVGLTQKILKFKRDITSLELIPSTRGVFEVVIDGTLVYSKKETGEFPDPARIIEKIRQMRQL